MLCCLAVGVPNPRYRHAQEWSRMHVKELVVHVSVWWITETRKDPACTLLTGAKMYFCTVNGNSRVMTCTLSIAHWQQASKLSTLRRFESIWKDWNKCAYQCNNNTLILMIINIYYWSILRKCGFKRADMIWKNSMRPRVLVEIESSSQLAALDQRHDIMYFKPFNNRYPNHLQWLHPALVPNSGIHNSIY